MTTSSLQPKEQLFATASPTTAADSASSSSFKEALDAFYEIHQKSQISGVATNVYNASLEKLGIDTHDTFAATVGIHLLEAYGYNTGRPSDEAIIRHGSVDQISGNKTYIKNASDISAALSDEAQTLKPEEAAPYIGARNYYDVAINRTNATSSASAEITIQPAPKNESIHFKKNDTLPVIQKTESLNTDDTLRLALKNEIKNLLINDKNLLRDVLKELL